MTREIASWLPRSTPLMQRGIVEAAIRGIGILEEPLGSNRGPEIDTFNLRAGVPTGSYWCASWAGCVWLEAGAEVPKGFASCDAWLAWGKATNRFTQHASAPGSLVVYGTGNDARHCGIVIRTSPIVVSIEANTTIEGSAFERNGTAVALKIVNERDPVLGFVHPLDMPTLARAA